jgi:thioredoxin reductase
MYDVIIIGGSYAGLSAAMALGRSLTRVLLLDSGKPCNRQTPYSHNFITQDGETPAAIAQKARAQVLAYPTIHLVQEEAVVASGANDNFTVQSSSGNTYQSRKLLFTTGIKDLMPAIPGFAESWGISVLHCPYCHGYEVRQQTLGIFTQQDLIIEMVKLIRNWSKDLLLFTNAAYRLTPEQQQFLDQWQVPVVEQAISHLAQEKGKVSAVATTDGQQHNVNAIFSRMAFEQHCVLPVQLGCEPDASGLLVIDAFHHTTIPGIFAAGDNCSAARAVSMATAAGTMAGVMINKELIASVYN